MKFGELTYNEFTEKIKAFHGTVAPGIVLGGFMVNLALENLPEGIFFDVICETKTCLPDAIQLLTPCSVGNGWLKILDLGRFAAVFYDKYTGEGIRIYLDQSKLNQWGEVKTWFLKLKPKDLQDTELIFKQMKEAGTSLFSIQEVKVHSKNLKKKKMGKTVTCPICDESYPESHGVVCRGCTEELPYDVVGNENSEDIETLLLHKTPVEQAVGMHLLHDVTRIIYKKTKGVAFKKGHMIIEDDVQTLRELGKNNVYVQEHNTFIKGYKHEDEVVLAFAKNMSGQNVTFDMEPNEGRINLVSDIDGILIMNEEQLENFNMSPGVMCAALPNYSIVKKGDKIAATRAIPLYISNKDYLIAMNMLSNERLFTVCSLRKAKVGILVTGTEVYENLIEDRYIEIIESKVEAYGCNVVTKAIVPDDIDVISSTIHDMVHSGADLIITTAGLSVDPDDMTLDAIIEAGAEELLYGVPVLPGSMLVLGQINHVQIIGVPGCGLYNNEFSFDLLLPRLLANVKITRKELARMGNGGLLFK